MKVSFGRYDAVCKHGWWGSGLDSLQNSIHRCNHELQTPHWTVCKVLHTCLRLYS